MSAVSLVPCTPALARAVLARDLSGLNAGRGWPHADTDDALRPLAAAPDGTEGTFLVVVAGEVVGDCGWYGPPSDGEVEVGYGLAAPYRGRGFGGDAVRLLLAWVTAQEGVRRVVAETDATNTPSRRLLERLAFTLDTVGETTVRYVLDRPDFGRGAR